VAVDGVRNTVVVTVPRAVMQAPAVAVLLPPRRVIDVAVALALPVAVDPDVAVAAPVPVAGNPHMAGTRGGNDLVTRRRRADVNVDVRRRDRGHNDSELPIAARRLLAARLAH